MPSFVGCSPGIADPKHWRGKYTIQRHQSWRLPLVRPSKISSNEWYFLQLNLIDEVVKTTHHFPVQIGVVFILCLIDQIKVPAQDPRVCAVLPHMMQFMKELQFQLICLRTIDSCKPPRNSSLMSKLTRN
jgi:hypothetical protein